MEDSGMGVEKMDVMRYAKKYRVGIIVGVIVVIVLIVGIMLWMNMSSSDSMKANIKYPWNLFKSNCCGSKSGFASYLKSGMA